MCSPAETAAICRRGRHVRVRGNILNIQPRAEPTGAVLSVLLTHNVASLLCMYACETAIAVPAALPWMSLRADALHHSAEDCDQHSCTHHGRSCLQVESNKGVRQNEMQEVEPGAMAALR